MVVLSGRTQRRRAVSLGFSAIHFWSRLLAMPRRAPPAGCRSADRFWSLAVPRRAPPAGCRAGSPRVTLGHLRCCGARRPGVARLLRGSSGERLPHHRRARSSPGGPHHNALLHSGERPLSATAREKAARLPGPKLLESLFRPMERRAQGPRVVVCALTCVASSALRGEKSPARVARESGRKGETARFARDGDVLRSNGLPCGVCSAQALPPRVQVATICVLTQVRSPSPVVLKR
eukprot:1195892-Prorocentrum_minimum.AAC.1